MVIDKEERSLETIPHSASAKNGGEFLENRRTDSQETRQSTAETVDEGSSSWLLRAAVLCPRGEATSSKRSPRTKQEIPWAVTCPDQDGGH